MKNHKKILLLLILIIFVILMFTIIQIYAKYLTSATGNTKIKIANWNISVNDISIKNNTDLSSSISPVFPGNEHIASGIIAPNAEGYFDLNFDFSGADVSFKYEINTSADESSSVKDLVATGYSIDDGEKINFANFNDPITDTIALNSNINTRKIRIFVKWNDDSQTAQMSNEEDTLSTKSDTPALFYVKISFTQIAK